MNEQSSQPYSIGQDILTWSAGRPAWQRDALRRIIVSGKVDQVDVKELVDICRSSHHANPPGTVAVQTINLDAAHISSGAGFQDPTSLISLGGLKGVNRLPSSQTLKFGATPGITVIYGENGTGKSGYARVLKKACRSRGASPTIRPDAFAPVPSSSATGTITFRVGANDYSATWTDSTASDARLGNVFIFDSSTAGNYLEQDGPASFTPHGLDILPKLSKLCDLVKEILKKDADAISAEITATSKVWTFSPTTEVGKLILSLGATSTESDITALAGLDVAKTKRLQELSETLRTDPKQKARETRAAAARLKTFAALIKAANENLSDAAMTAIKQCQSGAQATEQAAKTFANGKFDSSYLTGTGENFWRKLWDAAQEFSKTAAYSAREFPFTGDKSVCVLCQQTLDAKAIERFKKFHAFFTDKSQELAAEASKKLRQTKVLVEKLSTIESEFKKVETDLSIATQNQINDLTAFVAAHDGILNVVKNSLITGVWTETTPLPQYNESVLITISNTLEARAKEEESAGDPVARKILEAERDELNAREWLGLVKNDVITQVSRYKKVAALEACQRDTLTTAITSKNGALTKQVVTDVFLAKFEDELNELGLRTLGVQLQEISGTKGETKFGLRLRPQTSMSVRDVASEGEQRCIALAAFLAELSQTTHKSTLVFDDPVSSLDHYHRERIAQRLAKESKIRQVIVFTHDAVFLNDLCTYIDEYTATHTYIHLAWNGSEPGHCYDGLPWDCKSPEDRLNYLEQRYAQIKATWGPKPSDANVTEMRSAYSWLRQTIERMVEKIVFADVIFRYRSYVNFKNLVRATGFSQNECAEIERLFKRCCNVTDAHDAPQGKQAAIPDPVALKTDIDATKTLLENIRARQKAAAASAKGPTTQAP